MQKYELNIIQWKLVIYASKNIISVKYVTLISGGKTIKTIIARLQMANH